MAKLILSFHRDDIEKPWVIASPETIREQNMFTEDEVTVLYDSLMTIKALPGYISSVAEFPDIHTYRINMSFDTLDNAQAARVVFNNPTPGTLIYDRIQVLRSKRQELGVAYVPSSEVV